MVRSTTLNETTMSAILSSLLMAKSNQVNTIDGSCCRAICVGPLKQMTIDCYYAFEKLEVISKPPPFKVSVTLIERSAERLESWHLSNRNEQAYLVVTEHLQHHGTIA